MAFFHRVRVSNLLTSSEFPSDQLDHIMAGADKDCTNSSLLQISAAPTPIHSHNVLAASSKTNHRADRLDHTDPYHATRMKTQIDVRRSEPFRTHPSPAITDFHLKSLA